MFKIKSKKGFSLVEILLAITIFSIFTVGITYLSLDTLHRDAKVVLSNEALLYAQEGMEATRNIRDKNYLWLTNGDKGLELIDGSWEFGLAPEDIDGFYGRTITISDVYRDEFGGIKEEGTIFDPDTKRVDVSVAWMQNGIIPKEVNLTEYMSNWRGDDWIETACSEFNLGTFDSSETFELEEGSADDCGVKLAEIELASEFQTSADVGKHGTDVIVDGNYAYMTVSDNSTGLQIVNISNKSAPSITSTLNVGGKGRYINKIGDVVYVGVGKNTAGMAAVRVSNPASPSLASTIGSSAYRNRADKTGDYLYIPFEKNSGSLWIYRVIISGGSSTVQSVRNINFGDAIRYILINGSYAYLGLYDDYTGFKILSLADPTNPQTVGSLQVGEEVNAIGIDGNIAYLGTENSTNSLRIVNISNPASPVQISALDVGGEIKDLVISGNYLYAAVDRPHNGLATVNISNPYIPVLAYTLDVQGKGSGIDADGGYIYVTTTTANKGLIILGETVSGSSTNGTFFSQIFDTGSSDTIYNFIEWDAEEPNGTSIKFQVRTSDSEENIESGTWVGPDGTNSTYYENSRTVINLSDDRSGERFFQYKVFLESDGTSTPVLNSIRINYTP
ncbi:MAG: prepilin-type N-terminal cleavage/methylation domain-containing protein [Candidatus Gracilibacteria bacterium]|nr:prepilin-type N-terminal cleavage/methylation domain-containing protein [Candidatus Gracilibacteria bacterium]